MNNLMFGSDSYKYTHGSMLMDDTQGVYSYFESRKGSHFDKTIFYGLQYILKKHFLGQVVTRDCIEEADAMISQHLGPGIYNRAGWEYILEQHGGRLPLRIRAVREGTKVTTSNVMMTVENTDERVPWLTNYAETALTHVWYPSTVASLAYDTKELLRKYLEETSDAKGDEAEEILGFQLHDFGCRGTETMGAAAIGGSAHLLSFNGTDTVPALTIPRHYYNAGNEVYGYSVRATEHSIMTARGEEGEFDVVAELLRKNPTGVMAMVIDSYNYERFLHTCGTRFRDVILSRPGRIVFRPDSGDIVEVSQRCLEILGMRFGYETNSKGYKVLPDQVRVLWGDGIDKKGIDIILGVSKKNGWSSENWVFGMGGGLLQKVNRDVCRFAFKCSSQKYGGIWHDVKKNPLDSSKASKAGRLKLIADGEGGFATILEGMYPDIPDQLETVFENGVLLREQTFAEIRDLVRAREPWSEATTNAVFRQEPEEAWAGAFTAR